jgi:hypothetical protein
MTCIERVLVISTLHIPSPAAIDGSWVYIEHDQGCWTWVYSEEACIELMAPWLAPVCAYAKARNCNWIHFDSDADQIAELPAYPGGWE